MENLSHYEDTLLILLTELSTELSTMAVHNPETDDWEIKTDGSNFEEADGSLLADAFEAADTQVATLAELENQYSHVKLALRKIKTGTYGTCELCGMKIDSARLAVNPVARTCRQHMNEESQLAL